MTTGDQNLAPEAVGDIARLLAWYRAMGVDCAVGAEAVDWREHAQPPGAGFAMRGTLADAAVAQPPLRAPAPVRAPQPTMRPEVPATQRAQRPRVEAKSLAELEAKLSAFDGCGLKNTATKLCFYRGAETARVMIIGEAPGREEDLAGKPFVGPAGQMLDKMLAAINLSEADVHITNTVYWRPPGNRPPAPQETLACKPFLDRQTELVRPDVVLLLGGPATKHILGIDDGIMRTRGKWHDVSIGAHRVRALATMHPAFLLRTPAAKRLAWRDLLSLGEKLK